jgi:hypothetical protein
MKRRCFDFVYFGCFIPMRRRKRYVFVRLRTNTPIHVLLRVRVVQKFTILQVNRVTSPIVEKNDASVV